MYINKFKIKHIGTVNTNIQGLHMSINKYIQINTNNIEYPDNLKQLWNISNGLNLLGCVYNTYGLIIFSIDHISDYKNTLGVFGDMENMNSWYISSNDKPNTVSYYSENSLWLCIGCFNEYDFIFIQVNILNINYGKIKIITNNCCLERFVTIKSNLIDDLYNIYLTDYKY